MGFLDGDKVFIRRQFPLPVAYIREGRFRNDSHAPAASLRDAGTNLTNLPQPDPGGVSNQFGRANPM